MIYEEMRLKKSTNTVRVYSITGNTATIFDPEMHHKNNNGWKEVKLSQLVPMDFPLNGAEWTSKTKKNKAKSRLHIEDAIWVGSDGTRWMHSQMENAIAHELELMDKEINKEEVNETA